MRKLFLLLLLVPLTFFSVSVNAEDLSEDDIDIDLDDIEGLASMKMLKNVCCAVTFIIPISSVSITRRSIICVSGKS